MYRVSYRSKQWRTRWPWKWLFPLTLDDRLCRTCGLPFHNGPVPKALTQFSRGSIGAIIYPAGNWQRGQLAVKVGRWKSGYRDLYLSEYIPVGELDDAVAVIQHVQAFANRLRKTRSARW